MKAKGLVDENPWDQVSSDLKHKIVALLSPKDAAAMSAVSKEFDELSRSHPYWQRCREPQGHFAQMFAALKIPDRKSTRRQCAEHVQNSSGEKRQSYQRELVKEAGQARPLSAIDQDIEDARMRRFVLDRMLAP